LVVLNEKGTGKKNVKNVTKVKVLSFRNLKFDPTFTFLSVP